jgi:large subunit ribosomal protein L30
MKKLKIIQKKSIIGVHWRKRRTMEALGLKKINHYVIQEDNPTIRGMIQKVKELIEVKEITEDK